MKTLLMLLCSLPLLSIAVPAKFQCAYSKQEYFCLVPKKCVDSGTTVNALVVLEPDMKFIKDKCEAIVRFKFVDDLLWVIRIDYEQIAPLRYSLLLETDRLFNCGLRAGSDIVRRTLNDKPDVIEGYENCEYDIKPQFGPNGSLQKIESLFTDSKKLFLKLETHQNREKKKFVFEGSLEKLALAVVTTRGCDENLITLAKSETVIDGEILPVSKRLIGNNAEINCKKENADVLYIQLENQKEEKVHSVFCQGNAWAYRKLNQERTPVFIGGETFEMKCVRNWCKYCGELDEMPCEAGNCEPVMNYDNCVPVCPRDLWYFGKLVRRTSMKCKKLTDGKGDYGAWMATVNGVDTPVASASCYIGPFPLLDEATTKSAPSTFLWSIIAFTAVLLV